LLFSYERSLLLSYNSVNFLSFSSAANSWSGSYLFIYLFIYLLCTKPSRQTRDMIIQ